MTERVLVVNAGSSSLKLSVLTPDGTVHAATTVERWNGRTDLGPLRRFLDEAGEIDAVGHRVVHGGARLTPLAGLVMVTRSGDVDPGLLTWLLRHGGIELDELNDALENRSGLKGLSGTSGDLRDVLAGRADGDPDCTLAFDVFVHRLCREIAAMTAATGGLDLLVMTGGVGEHAPLVRAQVAARLAYLGVQIDSEANECTTGDGDISSADAPARTVVVTAREDLEITRRTAALLAADSTPA